MIPFLVIMHLKKNKNILKTQKLGIFTVFKNWGEKYYKIKRN